jgi:hypothetical protein
MPTFCTKCGSPLSGPFCVKCGAAAQTTNASPATQPAAAEPQAPVVTASTTTPKSSGPTRILVGFAVVVVVTGALAAGGVYYAVHRVKQKVHEMANGAPAPGTLSGVGSKSSDGDGSSKMSTPGAACHYLSKEEVSKAIGVEIVAVQSDSYNDCAYLAHGTSADMTAKHMSAMVAAKGADAQGRKMTEQVAGGLFKALEDEHGDSNQDSAGNVPVVTISIDGNSAETQMRLNAKVVGNLGPAPKALPGIGDEAFDMAGGMVMMRKGDKLVRIMYSMCPCAVDAIKPLAKTLADSL